MGRTKTIGERDATIDERFLIRTVIITLVLSTLIFLYALTFSWRWAVIYYVISLLTTAYFYLFFLIFRRFLYQQTKGVLFLLIFMKFFGIIGAGLLFLMLFGFNLTAFLAGFNTLFIVLILRVVGVQLFLRENRERIVE